MNSRPTLIQHFFTAAPLRPDHEPAYLHKFQSHWHHVTWREARRRVLELANGFLGLGIKPQTSIAILATTRPEWWLLDLAIMAVRGVSVPIYHNQTPSELAYILQNSHTRVLVVENLQQLAKWQAMSESCPLIEHVILIEGSSTSPKVIAWDEFVGRGQAHAENDPEGVDKRLAELTESDLATLIYTSGTTGLPKGVELTHRQLLSEAEDVLAVIPIGPGDRTLTFLPFAHVLGRVEGWGAVMAGYTLGFAENLDRLRENLNEVRPTFMVGVPRVFEKLHAAILATAEANSPLHKVFQWALEVGLRVSRLRQAGEPVPVLTSLEHAAADRVVFKSIREKLGGRLRFAVCGGAPLSAEIAEFFHAAGILILEGYGLTETTAAITTNTPLRYRFGTVGRALPDVEIKLAPDGEILVRSQKVMRGYHGQNSGDRSSPSAGKSIRQSDESTESNRSPSPIDAPAIDAEGFFATGDIGQFDHDGFLRITDRKKDLIKTAGGKYVAPQKLENMLKSYPLISQAIIHGDQEKYVVALLTLDPVALRAYATQQGISYPDLANLSLHPAVRAAVRTIVAEVNNQLSSHESIKNFGILAQDLSIEAGELTPSLKVKRKFCSEKFREQIRALYG